MENGRIAQCERDLVGKNQENKIGFVGAIQAGYIIAHLNQSNPRLCRPRVSHKPFLPANGGAWAGIENGEAGLRGRYRREWRMENGEWRMENGEWRMENGEWRMGNGEWGMENGEWRMGNGEWGMENGRIAQCERDLVGKNQENKIGCVGAIQAGYIIAHPNQSNPRLCRPRVSHKPFLPANGGAWAGIENGEAGLRGRYRREWRMGNGEWRMGNGEWRMAVSPQCERNLVGKNQENKIGCVGAIQAGYIIAHLNQSNPRLCRPRVSHKPLLPANGGVWAGIEN